MHPLGSCSASRSQWGGDHLLRSAAAQLRSEVTPEGSFFRSFDSRGIARRVDVPHLATAVLDRVLHPGSVAKRCSCRK